MTREGEGAGYSQPVDPTKAPLPRLFSDTERALLGGTGGGEEGVGEADDRVTAAGPSLEEDSEPQHVADDLAWLDGKDLAEAATHHRGGGIEAELARILERYRRSQAAGRTRRLLQDASRPHFTAEQRLLILDSQLRSKLPAGDFAPLVGLSPHTLRAWKARFAEHGPAGLDDRPMSGPRGSRLSEATKRSILLLKEQHADWGQDRIAAVLLATRAAGALCS